MPGSESRQSRVGRRDGARSAVLVQGVDPTVILLANSLGASEAADYRSPGEPILPSLPLIGGGRQFASSIHCYSGASLMGLSPWSNPVANPRMMLGFQVGMFAFWATVATAPRVFLDRRGPGRHARQRIVRSFVPYFVLVYGVGLTVPERLWFAIIIPLIVVGYSSVMAKASPRYVGISAAR